MLFDVIVGEVANLRDGRQSLFARLSARMGFSGPSQGSHPSFASLSHHNRSDSNSQGHFSGPSTPKKAQHTSSTPSSAAADASQPSAVAGGSNLNNNTVTSLNSRESGGREPSQQHSSLRPKQQEQLPQKVQSSFGSLVPVAVGKDAAQSSPFAAVLQHAGSMTPTRSNQQVRSSSWAGM